jgi:hypothetical protein
VARGAIDDLTLFPRHKCNFEDGTQLETANLLSNRPSRLLIIGQGRRLGLDAPEQLGPSVRETGSLA